jgi:hypothetical protein
MYPIYDIYLSIYDTSCYTPQGVIINNEVSAMSRIKGSVKTGGAVVGSVQTQTREVKRAILRVFNAVNEDDEYLEGVAHNDKKLFLSLVARILPTDVSVEQKVKFDLGAAMQTAADNAQRAALAYDTAQVIDVTPEPVTPDTAPVEVKPVPPLINERVLPAGDRAAATEPERWAGYDD